MHEFHIYNLDLQLRHVENLESSTVATQQYIDDSKSFIRYDI